MKALDNYLMSSTYVDGKSLLDMSKLIVWIAAAKARQDQQPANKRLAPPTDVMAPKHVTRMNHRSGKLLAKGFTWK